MREEGVKKGKQEEKKRKDSGEKEKQIKYDCDKRGAFKVPAGHLTKIKPFIFNS